MVLQPILSRETHFCYISAQNQAKYVLQIFRISFINRNCQNLATYTPFLKDFWNPAKNISTIFIFDFSLLCFIHMALLLSPLSPKLNTLLISLLRIQHWTIMGLSVPHLYSHLIVPVERILPYDVFLCPFWSGVSLSLWS